MPTLAAAGNSGTPEGVAIDGLNILPLATAQAPGLSREILSRQTLFWQSGYYRVVRHNDWKLQVSINPNKAWLFNLAADPTEQTNLAAAEPLKLAELQALLDAHAASARAPLYPYVAELPVAVDKDLSERFKSSDEYVMWPN
jgi:uncharacterized sulfatase